MDSESELYKRRFRAIFEQSNIPSQIYSDQGHIISTNSAWHKWTGVSPEILQKTVSAGYCLFQDPTLIKYRVVDNFRQALTGEAVQGKPVLYNLADHSPVQRTVWVQSNFYPIPDAAGKIAEVMILHHDVSELMKEKARADRERDDAMTLVRTVLDETRAVIYIKDPEGHFTFVNGQFCRIFEKSSDEVLGKNNHQLFPKDIADQFQKNDLHVLETNSHLEKEELAVHADGSVHTYLSLKFPLHDSTGARTGVCGISTDITEHRRIQHELHAAKRMESVGLMAGGIAHDFNNIIEIILLVADTLLLTGAKEKPDWEALINSMKNSAEGAALLTRQLLAFGQKHSFNIGLLDVGEVILGTKDILENALGADIHFLVDIQPERWPVLADPLQIEQILTNLCFNARDAMPRGGQLRVAVRNVQLSGEQKQWRVGKPKGDFVELVVSDTGVGIDPAILERIFEPFFTTKKSSQGSGLGLATVYGLISAAGGDIAVQSSPGRGSEFSVLFPKATGSIRAGGLKTESPSEFLGGTETVLLVEDRETLREVTAKLLRETGYTVFEAADANAAMDLWNAHHGKIDLVLTDIVMPGLSGLEMLERMSASAAGRPPRVILVSAYTDTKLANYGLNQEALQIVRKPYSGSELLRKIREALRPLGAPNS